MFESNSPTKWRDSSNYEEMCTLWLPDGCYEDSDIERFKEWCNAATSEVLWLELNRNIYEFFDNELDFCIACDFNFVYGNGRTAIGEAEYQLKYNLQNLEEWQKIEYEDEIINNMLNACRYIPIHDTSRWCLSPMPALESGKKKLAWGLSKEMSNQLRMNFVDATLLRDKPQMKQLSVGEKIQVWDDIYENGSVEIRCDVRNKNVLIIDDLYQSGTTMWEYAKYLKSLGARSVWGLVCVKSLKDSDNK